MTEQNQESLKVYELAKELGIDSFALLDKLKSINIEVKSHMSSLAAEQMKAIREAFQAEKKSKSPASSATKKRSSASSATKAAGASTAKTAAAPAASAAATPAKKVVKKASAAAAPPVVETPAAAESADAPKRKIIKRRTDADGTQTIETLGSTKKADGSDSQGEMGKNAQDDTGSISVMDPAEEQKLAEQVALEAAAQIEARKAEAIAAYTPKPNAPGTKAQLRVNNNQRVVEKDELLEEFASRKLKIVQVAPPAGSPQARANEPTYRTPGGPAAGTAKKTTGFSQQKAQDSSEMFQPSFTSFPAKEDEGRKKGASAAPKNPEDVRISDFRKRELVFQPKRKKLPPGKLVKQTEITTPSAQKRKIKIENKIIVSELAQRMGEKANTIIAKLMNLGVMASVNHPVDFDTASLIAGEFGYEVENVAFQETKVFVSDKEENMQARPPIITVMGHVDHGKTSLLDAIRNAKVAEGEAGGITQHIGAYSVSIDGKPLTFLDTPGHEAFANMRSRGANVTDIVVLVVAADDSIMPQTQEAIAHAQTAKVPIIVAANKVDKPAANLDKVKKDLSANNILVEEWGGEVPMVPVSALKKTGIKELLETISVQAEVLDLKADPDRSAEGVILEARMEKGRGAVADLLVRKGTLRAGDFVVVGASYGRVRAMTNDRGQDIKEVKPGFPAEVIGLTEVPSAGDSFHVVSDETAAKEVAESRKKKLQEEKAQALAPKTMSLEELMNKLPNPDVKELNVIVKADVFGSSEAIKESIEKIKSDKVKAKVLQCGVGVITENDVLFAKTANALVLGFNSKPDSKARDTAKREKVDVRHYSIIYELLDEVKVAMENMLEPIRKETPIGKAEVKQTFSVSKIGTIAGSVVLDGKITRNAFARVVRGKDIVHEGKVVSLKRFKDDASETIKGQECGIGVENYESYMPGDIIHVFHVELVKQSL